MADVVIPDDGSPPQARRRLGAGRADRDRGGLIPAGAGTTTGPCLGHRRRTAHPRRRGDDQATASSVAACVGSPPQARGRQVGHVAPGADVRLTPAGAGRTVPGFRPCCCRKAHPRRRGENTPAKARTAAMNGSPPQARGELCNAPPRPRPRRLTPAGAGRTRPRCSSRRSTAAHPRRRGENEHVPRTLSPWRGSPPQARGERRPRHRGHGARRLTPAGAGETARRRRPWPSTTAHPRRRGENASFVGCRCPKSGSPPQARGELPFFVNQGYEVRLTPAGAGRTRWSPRSARRTTAHPRRRGENHGIHTDPTDVHGSPPQARGELRRMELLMPGVRLTPAGAGRTQPPTRSTAARTAHPRRRGENAAAVRWPATVSGSPPQARGELGIGRADRGSDRLTPAGAGRTCPPPTRSTPGTAHPRRRGENCPLGATQNASSGSPPQARGEHRRPGVVRHGLRLTPAGAGRTPARPRAVWRAAAHPRRRGENRAGQTDRMSEYGSPPQARGERPRRSTPTAGQRLTPAGAGRTLADLPF